MSRTTRMLGMWWPPALASGITALLWLFGAGKELWYSERFVQVIGALSWREMFSLLKFENNPPLWFIVARAWQSIAGASETHARLLTLFITMCFFAVLWWCTRAMTDTQAARRTVLLASVAGFVVLQSVEYRMYSLVMLCSTIALFCAWQYSQRPDRRYLIGLVATSVLGFHMHYTYAIVIAFTWAWVFLTQRTRWRAGIIGVGATIAGMAPWFMISLWPILSDLGSNLSVQQRSAPWWSLVLLPFHTYVPRVFQEALWLFILRVAVSAAVLACIVRALRSADMQRRKCAWYLVLFVACCIVFSSVLRLTLDKYAAAAVPAVLMLVGIGIGIPRLRRAFRVTMMMVVIAGSVIVSFQLVRTPNSTYRAAAEIVEQGEQAGDRLIVVPFNDDIAVRPYYRGSLAVTGFFPAKDPGTVTLQDNIRNNFKSVVTADTIGRLEEYVGDAQGVWLFYDIPMSPGFWNGHLIDAWFKRNGFVSVVYRSVFRNVPPLLVHYSRTLP